MSPLDTPVAIALIAVSVITFAVLIVAGLARAAGRPAAHPPARLNRGCAYLSCTEPADDWIYDRAMCAGHAEAIRGRSDR